MVDYASCSIQDVIELSLLMHPSLLHDRMLDMYYAHRKYESIAVDAASIAGAKLAANACYNVAKYIHQEMKSSTDGAAWICRKELQAFITFREAAKILLIPALEVRAIENRWGQ